MPRSQEKLVKVSRRTAIVVESARALCRLPHPGIEPVLQGIIEGLSIF
jgi:hypothetical protein